MKVTMSYNGAEVTQSPLVEFRHPDGPTYAEFADPSVATATSYLAQGFYLKVVTEYVCGDCGQVVDGPSGHDHDVCMEARSFE